VKKIGLTGTIGSGKSLAAEILATEFEIPSLDSDKLAKELMLEPMVKQKIIQAFGSESYLEEGILNTDYLASKVFRYDEEIEKLERIVHPPTREKIFQWFMEQQRLGANLAVVESAILFRTSLHEDLDGFIIIVAKPEVAFRRVQHDRELERKDFQRRLNNQQYAIPDGAKVFKIVNNATRAFLRQGIRQAVEFFSS